MLYIRRLRKHVRQFIVAGLSLAMLGLSFAIWMASINAPILDGSEPLATSGKVSNLRPADSTRQSASDKAVINSSPTSPLTSLDQPAQARASGAYSKLPPLSQADRGRTDSSNLVRLSGEVPVALASATKLPEKMAADAPLVLTIVFKRPDQAGFDRYFKDVYDSRSPSFHHFLSQGEISERFGPTRKAYGDVLDYLRRQGFTLIEGSANRLTLTVRGRRAQVERAFKVEIRDFEAGGRRFFSNDRDPALPRSLASNILAVTGLSNLVVPESAGVEEFPAGRQLALLAGGLFGPGTLANLERLLELANEQGGTVSFIARNPSETIAQAFAFSVTEIQQAIFLVQRYGPSGGAFARSGERRDGPARA